MAECRRSGLAPDMLRYIHDRPLGLFPGASTNLMRHKLSNSKNLFRKDLHAHYGCVNAIEFSNEGDWLISGGDDRRVLLWNVEKAIQGKEDPVSMTGEHNSNIFCLGFDNQNAKIFSAGNDEQVIVHDTRTGATLDVFLHEEAVYGISVDPINSSVFASACDDGRVLIWDIREPSSTDPFCLASYSSAFHAVMYNPAEPRLLATANSKEGVSLWDVRQPRSWLMKYGGALSTQSCMSVRFSQNGSRLLALRRRLPPILYDIYSPTHICQFDHTGYYNSCTMKSCCFAGDDDQYVLSGSDDFNLYMWKVPEEGSRQNWVDEAHMVLRGHRSIVNQVRFSPSNFLFASSGVEKIIKFWSPFTIPRSTGGLKRSSRSADKQRKVYSHIEYVNMVMHSGEVMTHDYSHKSTKEDPRMMAFFDSLVQREIEGLASDSSLSSGTSDSWLYNVAGTAILSDLATSSDGGTSEDDVVTIDRPSPGPLHRGLGSPAASGGGGPEVNGDEESRATDDDGGGSNSSGGDQSVTNTISWLIKQKRQQMLQAAREKIRKESLREGWVKRKKSVLVTTTPTRSNGASPTSSVDSFLTTTTSSSPPSSIVVAAASSDATAVEVSSISSSSSVSLTSSSPRLVDEDAAERASVVAAAEVQDRRKILRKRRARILQDLSDSDSGMDDDDDKASTNRRKRFCHVTDKSSSCVTSAFRPYFDDDVCGSSSNSSSSSNSRSSGGDKDVGDKTSDVPTRQTSGAASSSDTPDSGVAFQPTKDVAGGLAPLVDPGLHQTAGHEVATATTTTKFKRVRGSNRQYRGTSAKVASTDTD